jgi:hypothetical protein
MIGSDVGAREVILTHELRDALEGNVAARMLQAPPTREHIYIPEFVKLQDDQFTYRAMLTRDNKTAVRETLGTCSRAALKACARQILVRLGIAGAS